MWHICCLCVFVLVELFMYVMFVSVALFPLTDAQNQIRVHLIVLCVPMYCTVSVMWGTVIGQPV